MIIQHNQMLELKDLESNGSTPFKCKCNPGSKTQDAFFDERHDDLDTYLTRFERIARVQKWEEDTWGIRLGTLLKGKALEVYNGLVDDEVRSNEALTNALRDHLRLTQNVKRKSSGTVNAKRAKLFNSL